MRKYKTKYRDKTAKNRKWKVHVETTEEIKLVGSPKVLKSWGRKEGWSGKVAGRKKTGIKGGDNEKVLASSQHGMTAAKKQSAEKFWGKTGGKNSGLEKNKRVLRGGTSPYLI